MIRNFRGSCRVSDARGVANFERNGGALLGVALDMQHSVKGVEGSRRVVCSSCWLDYFLCRFAHYSIV